MNNKQIILLCTAIEEDVEKDAENFDGQPFTGKTVAEYFGNQGAAIAALARAIKDIVSREEGEEVE